MEDVQSSLRHSPEGALSQGEDLPIEDWTRFLTVDYDPERVGPAEKEIWDAMEREQANERPVNDWVSNLMPSNRFHPRVLSPGAIPMASIKEEGEDLSARASPSSPRFSPIYREKMDQEVTATASDVSTNEEFPSFFVISPSPNSMREDLTDSFKNIKDEFNTNTSEEKVAVGSLIDFDDNTLAEPISSEENDINFPTASEYEKKVIKTFAVKGLLDIAYRKDKIKGSKTSISGRRDTLVNQMTHENRFDKQEPKGSRRNELSEILPLSDTTRDDNDDNPCSLLGLQEDGSPTTNHQNVDSASANDVIVSNKNECERKTNSMTEKITACDGRKTEKVTECINDVEFESEYEKKVIKTFAVKGLLDIAYRKDKLKGSKTSISVRKDTFVNQKTHENRVDKQEPKGSRRNELSEIFPLSDTTHDDNDDNPCSLLGLQEGGSPTTNPQSDRKAEKVTECINDDVHIQEVISEMGKQMKGSERDVSGGNIVMKDSSVPAIFIIDESASSLDTPQRDRFFQYGDFHSENNTSLIEHTQHNRTETKELHREPKGEYIGEIIQRHDEDTHCCDRETPFLHKEEEIFISREEKTTFDSCSSASQSNSQLPLICINEGITDILSSERNSSNTSPSSPSLPTSPSIDFLKDNYSVSQWPPESPGDIVPLAIRVTQWKQFWDQKVNAQKRKDECKITGVQRSIRKSSNHLEFLKCCHGPPNSPQRKRLHPSIRIPGIVNKWRQSFENVVDANKVAKEFLKHRPIKKRKSILKQHNRDGEETAIELEISNPEQKTHKHEAVKSVDISDEVISVKDEPKLQLSDWPQSNLVTNRKQTFEASSHSSDKRKSEYFQTIPPRRDATKVAERRKFWDELSKGQSCDELERLVSQTGLTVTQEIFIDEQPSGARESNMEVDAELSHESDPPHRECSETSRAVELNNQERLRPTRSLELDECSMRLRVQPTLSLELVPDAMTSQTPSSFAAAHPRVPYKWKHEDSMIPVTLQEKVRSPLPGGVSRHSASQRPRPLDPAPPAASSTAPAAAAATLLDAASEVESVARIPGQVVEAGAKAGVEGAEAGAGAGAGRRLHVVAPEEMWYPARRIPIEEVDGDGSSCSELDDASQSLDESTDQSWSIVEEGTESQADSLTDAGSRPGSRAGLAPRHAPRPAPVPAPAPIPSPARGVARPRASREARSRFENAKLFFQTLEQRSEPGAGGGSVPPGPWGRRRGRGRAGTDFDTTSTDDTGSEGGGHRYTRARHRRGGPGARPGAAHSAPASDSETLARLPTAPHRQEAGAGAVGGGGRRRRQLSERFLVRGLFRDVAGGGVPHRREMLAALAAVEVGARPVSPYTSLERMDSTEEAVGAEAVTPPPPPLPPPPPSPLPRSYDADFPYLPATDPRLVRPRATLQSLAQGGALPHLPHPHH